MIEGEWGNYLKTDILAAIELAESQQRNDGEDGHNGGQCGCSAVVAADDLGIDCYRQGLGLAGIQDDGDRHSERDQKAVVFLSIFRFGRL